jgi:outer membrane protein OmpA-like peptidoglycan-associated protein
MRVRLFRSLTQLGLVGLLAVLVGCATAEVKSARQSLETARSAGKAKECPSDFAAAEQLVNQAESLCQQCKTQEANALANQAAAKVNALCPAKPTPPPPPPPPPAAAAPTVSISAASTSIEQGACTNLSWTTTNAKSTSIDQGVGAVDASGSRQVCPTSTTRYTLTANGDGGTRSDSATVNVAAKPTPTDKLTIHVNFETNKSDIRKADVSDLQKAEAFVKKYSACKIEIDGYTDSTGGPKINQPLSERRADAVKKWLLDHGATSEDHITTKGFGASNPVADNKTAKGRFQNRRAEILVFCQ